MSFTRLSKPALVLLGFAFFFVAFFAPVLFSTNLLAPGDAATQAIPTFFGRTPLLEPNMMLGYPLFADPNQAFWYPVIRVMRLLPDGFNAYVVFPYVVIAFGTFGFARRFSGSFTGGIVAALAMSLGGFMMGHEQHLMILHPACWAPYVLWAILELRDRSNPATVAAGAIALALGATAGTQQPLVYLVFIGIVFALCFRPSEPERRVPFARDVVCVLLLGGAVAAIALIPAAAFVLHSDRAHQSLRAFSAYSTDPVEILIRLLFPYFLGNAASTLYAQARAPIGSFAESSNYAGILTLMLTVLAVLDPIYRRRAFFFSGAALWAAWMATGSLFGAASIARAIPVYGMFRIPGRHAFELCFALAVLASLGIAALESRRVSWFKLRVAIALPGAILISCLVMFSFVGHQVLFSLSGGYDVSNIPVTIETNSALGLPLAMFIVSAYGLALRWRFSCNRLTAAIVPLVICADMSLFAGYSYWRDNTEPASIVDVPSAVKPLGAALERAGGRFIDLGGTSSLTLKPNLPALWHLPDATAYVSLEDRSYANLTNVTPAGLLPSQFFDQGRGSLLDVLGVSYVLLPALPPLAAFRAVNIGGEIGAKAIEAEQRVTYRLDAPESVDLLEIFSTLQNSAQIPNGARVAEVTVNGPDGSHAFSMLAGRDVADAEYDVDAVHAIVKHARATIFEGPQNEHVYVAQYSFPRKTRVRSVSISWVYPDPSVGMMGIVNVGVVDLAKGVAYPFYSRGRFESDPSHFRERPRLVLGKRRQGVREPACVSACVAGRPRDAPDAGAATGNHAFRNARSAAGKSAGRRRAGRSPTTRATAPGRRCCDDRGRSDERGCRRDVRRDVYARYERPLVSGLACLNRRRGAPASSPSTTRFAASSFPPASIA